MVVIGNGPLVRDRTLGINIEKVLNFLRLTAVKLSETDLLYNYVLFRCYSEYEVLGEHLLINSSRKPFLASD